MQSDSADERPTSGQMEGQQVSISLLNKSFFVCKIFWSIQKYNISRPKGKCQIMFQRNP